MVSGPVDIFAGAVDSVGNQEGKDAEDIGIVGKSPFEIHMYQGICHSCHSAAGALVTCQQIKDAGDAQTGEGDHKEIGKPSDQNFRPDTEQIFFSLCAIHPGPLFCQGSFSAKLPGE